ncbi:hypothetical protein ABZ567_28610 [Streptomyces sp. NPDC016459]
MDTMSVNVATARSTADARECTRAFLDRLVRPIAVEVAHVMVLVVSEL